MSNHQEVIDLAKALTGNENLYNVQPFIKITGDTMLGLFLERIVYWSDKSNNKELRQLKIFYKTAEEWEEELGLSYAQVTRARKALESMGFIQTSKHKVAGAPTLHYYANVGAIKESITQYYQSSSVDYANLDNSEIQESSISENDTFQFEETVKTIEIQESEHSSYNSSNSNSNSTDGEGGKPPPIQESGQKPVLSEVEGLEQVELEVEKPPPRTEYTPFMREFLTAFSAKRFRNDTQAKTIAGLTAQFGEPKLRELIEWAANKGMGLGDAVASINSALTKPKPTKNGANHYGYSKSTKRTSAQIIPSEADQNRLLRMEAAKLAADDTD